MSFITSKTSVSFHSGTSSSSIVLDCHCFGLPSTLSLQYTSGILLFDINSKTVLEGHKEIMIDTTVSFGAKHHTYSLISPLFIIRPFRSVLKPSPLIKVICTEHRSSIFTGLAEMLSSMQDTAIKSPCPTPAFWTSNSSHFPGDQSNLPISTLKLPYKSSSLELLASQTSTSAD